MTRPLTCGNRQHLLWLLIASLLGVGGFHCWAQSSLTEIRSLAIDTRQMPTQTRAIVKTAKSQIGKTLIYDPRYEKIPYPGGDVPLRKGVCTDVVIRSLRSIGFDLQKEIHEDMKKSFQLYPQLWQAKGPDKNIDHRRVPNQKTFFKRKGWALPITKNKEDYLPGDIVAWRLDNGREHVGVVADRSTHSKRPLIIHNIGWGTRMEDTLFAWKIIGHYRWPQPKPDK